MEPNPEDLALRTAGATIAFPRVVAGPLGEHAAVCPRCAARLRAALLLMEGSGLRAAAPSGLRDRVVARIRLRDPAGPPSRGPRIAARILLPAAAALIAAVTVFVVLRVAGPPQAPTVQVVLVLEAPQATQVSVVGDWNGWNPEANPLSDPDGDGVWTVEIYLHRGEELRYQFLIDNQTWVPDPKAPFQIDDGFGGSASVLQT